MAANPGRKLALRKSAVRLNPSSSLHPTQYSNKSVQNFQRDIGGPSKPGPSQDAEDRRLSSMPPVQLAMSPVEHASRPPYQPPSCMLHLELPLDPLPCSKYLLCQQSTGDTTVGMATGTSSVKGTEDQTRKEPAQLEGAHPEGQLPPLPSPSFPLCKKPTSVWSEEYVWSLLTEDPQSGEIFGEGLETRSARMNMRVASSVKQSSEHPYQSRPSAGGSALGVVVHTTSTTSNTTKPHDIRTVCTTGNTLTDSPTQSLLTLVPETPSPSRPLPAALSTAISTASGGLPQSNVCNSTQSPPSPPVIDLTDMEDGDDGYDDQDFDKLFADVDMAQFEESPTLSQSHDHSVTMTLKQDSKVQSPSSKRGRNSSISSIQSESRAELYGNSGGGRVGSGRLALQTGVPSRSQKETASFSDRLEEDKSSVSSCPVCAVAFQPSMTQKQVDTHIQQCLDTMAIVID